MCIRKAELCFLIGILMTLMEKWRGWRWSAMHWNNGSQRRKLVIRFYLRFVIYIWLWWLQYFFNPTSFRISIHTILHTRQKTKKKCTNNLWKNYVVSGLTCLKTPNLFIYFLYSLCLNGDGDDDDAMMRWASWYAWWFWCFRKDQEHFNTYIYKNTA